MSELPSVSRLSLLREPIAQGLMLSIGLHVAVLALIHPMPSADQGSTLVINARLAPSPQQESAPQPDEESTPDVTEVADQKAQDIPMPLPAESLPVPKPAPIQQHATPAATVEQAPVQNTEITAKTDAPIPPAPRDEPAMAIGKPPVETPAITLPSPVDTTWYLARQVDRHPRAIGSIEPKYPELARQKGYEGSLKLMVRIDDLGQVRDVEVVEAKPPGVFDQAAVEAFRNARFRPAMKDGRPVRYEAYMRVEFKLE